jgi:hypothetical protein
MPNKGKFIGGQDNLFVPDAPTIGTATAGDTQVSIAFTAPSDVGADAVTLYGASIFLAGATINYRVSVGTGTLSTGGSGNVYFIDGIPTKTLSLIKGFTYVFDLSDGSNSGHPFGFKNASDGAYTTGVTTSGTAGSASATVTLVLATDASEPSRYYCTSHGNGMGNTISLIEASASTDPLGAAQASTTGSSSPITVTGLTNDTSYIAQVWAINDYGNGPLSAATSSFTPVAPAIALYMISNSNLDQFDMTSTGNATNFGTISLGEQSSRASVASATRYVLSGGEDSNALTYVTIATAGNGTDFGDAARHATGPAGLNNSTRGIFCGGISSSTRQVWMDYITIASTGNTTTFGNLTSGSQRSAGVSSPTRGVVGAGYRVASSGASNVMDYVTIASAGNATDFGDLTQVGNNGLAGFSSNTRGIFGSLHSSSTPSNVINYITIASAGNATDFGDLNTSVHQTTGFSNKIYGFFANGTASGGASNVIQRITIATTGNATDYADSVSSSSSASSGNSGSHGGIA